MLWDVTYERRNDNDSTHIIQVTAESLTHARREALPLVGSRSHITRIDRAYPDLPVYDPTKTTIQKARKR